MVTLPSVGSVLHTTTPFQSFSRGLPSRATSCASCAGQPALATGVARLRLAVAGLLRWSRATSTSPSSELPTVTTATGGSSIVCVHGRAGVSVPAMAVMVTSTLPPKQGFAKQCPPQSTRWLRHMLSEEQRAKGEWRICSKATGWRRRRSLRMRWCPGYGNMHSRRTDRRPPTRTARVSP